MLSVNKAYRLVHMYKSLYPGRDPPIRCLVAALLNIMFYVYGLVPMVC